jgi:hypothetical protein
MQQLCKGLYGESCVSSPLACNGLTQRLAHWQCLPHWERREHRQNTVVSCVLSFSFYYAVRFSGKKLSSAHLYKMPGVLRAVTNFVHVGLLVCNAVWTCTYIATFRRNILPASREVHTALQPRRRLSTSASLLGVTNCAFNWLSSKTVPWLRLLVSDISLRRPGFAPWSIHIIFVVVVSV